MKFILVNHRTPLDSSACAECSQSLGLGYLKAVSTRRHYCDYDCYLRYEARRLVTPWLNADRAAPFEMMTLFLTASCCYSIAIVGAAQLVSELATTEISRSHRERTI
jgi:hypothetical protein